MAFPSNNQAPYFGYPPMPPMFQSSFPQASQQYSASPSSSSRRTEAAPSPSSHRTSSQQAPPPGIPYIGARISLISNMNIRYEGTLYTIDAKEATVALQNVRCFGTEGRVSSGDEVGASPVLYQYIIFRGKDIKDLHVCETPPRFVPPQHPPPPQDPAIVASGGMGGPSFPFPEPTAFDPLSKKTSGFPFPIAPTFVPKSEGEDKQKEHPDDIPLKELQEKHIARHEHSHALPIHEPPAQSAPSQQQHKKKSTERGSGGQSKEHKQHRDTGDYDNWNQKGRNKSRGGSTQKLSQNSQSFRPSGSGGQGQRSQHSQQHSQHSQGGQRNKQSQNTYQKGGRVVPGSGGQTGASVAASSSTDINYEGPGTSSYLRKREPAAGAAAVLQEEFDIQSSNARFDKDQFREELKKKAAEEKKKPATKEGQTEEKAETKTTEAHDDLADVFQQLKKDAPKPAESSEAPPKEAAKYDKTTSFYDDISTDRDVAQRRDLQKRDTETFGDIAQNYGRNRSRFSNFNRGRRGGGTARRGSAPRGGGGGWRGGYGGYQQRRSNYEGGPSTSVYRAVQRT